MLHNTYSKIYAALGKAKTVSTVSTIVSVSAAYQSRDNYRNLNSSHYYHMIVRPPLTNGPGIVEEHKEVKEPFRLSRP